MSEHAWTLENLAAHVAGGLEPAERERLEQHVAACPDCRRALDAARATDRRLLTLFADVQPGPALEDRMIRTLRNGRPRSLRLAAPRIPFKAVLATAAVALLAVTGAAISALIDEDQLAPDRFPTPTRRASNRMKELDGTVQVAGQDLGRGSAAQSDVTAEHFAADEAAVRLRVEALTTFKLSGKGRPEYDQNLWSAQVDPLMAEMATGIKGIAERKDAKDGFAHMGPRTGVHLVDGDKNSPLLNLPAPGAVNSKRGGGRPGDALGFDFGLQTPPARPTAPPALAPAVPAPPAADQPAKAGNYFFPGNIWADGRTHAPGGGGPRSGASSTTFKDLSDQIAAAKQPQSERLLGAKLQKKVSDSAPPTPPAKAEAAPQKTEPPPAATAGRRYIIRSGDIDFEVDSFDNAVGEIQKLVAATKGGYIATINSDKLPNGKVKGSVVVRVPPEQLDDLVLGLRRELAKKGELKGQRIGSNDVSKGYTDTESRLKAARSMEERLLRIIKDGKGEIKDLVAAEKELGVWHTKIEEYEGELRYYNNLISLSTLTISLAEKEIRVAASVAENERVQTGIEVEDVEKAMREVLKAVEEAKGRVTRSEMKQHSAGQFNAQLEFEVAPESAGAVRDRLKQLGTVARLEIDRVQTAEGGEKLPQDGKLHRGNTRFFVSLYNVANMTPRETVVLRLYTENVAGAYATLRAAVAKAKALIQHADLNEQDRHSLIANLTFDVRRDEEPMIQAALADAGEVLSRQVVRAAAGENVTDTKVKYRLELIDNAAARETVVLRFAATDVGAAFRAIRDALTKAQARVVNASLNEQDRQSITGQLDFDVRRTEEGGILAALTSAGEVLSRQVVRAPEAANTTDKKVTYKVEFVPASAIEPREIVAVAIQVQDVEGTLSVLNAQVKELKGRIVKDPEVADEPNGNIIAAVTYEVPLSEAPAFAERLRHTGTIRGKRSIPNTKAPEGKLAIVRYNVTLTNGPLLVPRDEGLWANVRTGLSYSLRGLSVSVSWLIVGVLFVLPWAVLVLAVVWLVRRLTRSAVVVVAPPAAPSASA